MGYLMYCLLWNLMFVTVASILVYLLGLTRSLEERPALRHALWLLVLLKFVTPPLWAAPLLPAVQAEQSMPSVEQQVAETDRVTKTPIHPVTDESAGFSVHRTARTRDRSLTGSMISQILVGLSVIVTFIMGGLAVIQWSRLKKLSTHFIEPDQRLAEMLKRVCQSCHLSKMPELVVVNTICSPMLWVGFRRSTIILPRAIAETLSEEQLQQVLAHEIGHLVRKDYLSGLLAFGVIILFWWNPLAWLARREMLLAAETCCDAFAIAVTSGSRQSYARTLLAAVDFTNRDRSVLPAWGTQFLESRSLERRIKMVARSQVKSVLTHSHRGVIICLSLLVLVIVPVRAEKIMITQTENATEQEQDIRLQTDRLQQEKVVVPPNTRSANLPTIANVKLISWSGAETSSRAYFFETAQAAESFANLVKAFQIADQFKIEISETKTMQTDQDKRICIMPASYARQLGLDGDKYVLLQGTRAAHSHLEKVVSTLKNDKKKF
ncbi:Regulatory protein BlaR1 [Gimesia maris]|uniref:M56 family metallopeptidase n=1 Tax=Gimesia maris TaxID=122 RepID=UPI0011892244|nr:M56 family metallopeptidase [Gimesia maris]QDT80262.1 Regulatory protein BlaR1 [Gimesia maris]